MMDTMRMDTMLVRIEMVLPAELDPSTILERLQVVAVELTETVMDDELSPITAELVRALVSVEVVQSTKPTPEDK